MAYILPFVEPLDEKKEEIESKAFNSKMCVESNQRIFWLLSSEGEGGMNSMVFTFINFSYRKSKSKNAKNRQLNGVLKPTSLSIRKGFHDLIWSTSTLLFPTC